jgi:hypothetical protein
LEPDYRKPFDMLAVAVVPQTGVAQTEMAQTAIWLGEPEVRLEGAA